MPCHALQVTKLCDLAPGDSVCSVSWSQRGTYLSVGTYSGEVQVSTIRAAGREGGALPPERGADCLWLGSSICHTRVYEMPGSRCSIGNAALPQLQLHSLQPVAEWFGWGLNRYKEVAE